MIWHIVNNSYVHFQMSLYPLSHAALDEDAGLVVVDFGDAVPYIFPVGVHLSRAEAVPCDFTL